MGEPLPKQYFHCLDPFVALSYAAAATKNLRVGTGICLVAQHDPIVLAKTVATLDHLSGGRFDFGVGFGWNQDEMEHHGVPYAQRREVVRERVQGDEGAVDERAGRRSTVSSRASSRRSRGRSRCRSRIRRSYIGGAGGPKLFKHVAEWADGWIPIGGRGIKAKLPLLRAEYEKAGRDPDDDQDHPVRLPARSGQARVLRVRSGSKRSCSVSIPADRTSSCRSSTGTRRRSRGFTSMSEDLLHDASRRRRARGSR